MLFYSVPMYGMGSESSSADSGNERLRLISLYKDKEISVINNSHWAKKYTNMCAHNIIRRKKGNRSLCNDLCRLF